MDDDHHRVSELLGREPEGRYEVVARDAAGDPVVIRNAPLLDDGTPMPTRYWLVGAEAVAAVSRLESAGGVRAAEAAVDPAELAAAHARYAAERDAAVPPGAHPRPSGGVGGTRQGVKCLHAHYAWHLAGGDDPVGRWVAAQLDGERGRLVVDVSADRVVLHHAGTAAALATSPRRLLQPAGAGDEGLGAHDPPLPEDLTNGLGTVTDLLDNLLHEAPGLLDAGELLLRGEEAWHLARVERGSDDPGEALTIGRPDLEDLFRTIATEPRAVRLHNPALDPARVDTIVATACVTLAVMRRLHFAAATFAAPR